MAETIRDVTIRVSLEQVQGAALQVPDLKAANADFAATTQLLASIQSEAETAFNSLRESVTNVNVSEVTASFTTLNQTIQLVETQVAGLGPEAKSSIDLIIESLEDAAENAVALESALHTAEAALAELGDNGGDGVDRLRNAVDKAHKNLSELHDKAVKAALDVGEGFKTAGDGALTFARSAASLFAATEQDAEKLLESIGRVQQGFDLFKGAFDTVKGVTEAMRALTVATGASSAAEAIHIVTTKALTVALGETTVAALALDTALTPVLPILLALAAAAGALYVAWRWFNGADEDVNDATE